MVHGHGYGRHTYCGGGGGGGSPTSPGPIGGPDAGAGGEGVTGPRSFRALYCSVPPARSASSVCIQIEQIHMNFRIYDHDYEAYVSMDAVQMYNEITRTPGDVRASEECGEETSRTSSRKQQIR